jgi:hypothetical protein
MTKIIVNATHTGGEKQNNKLHYASQIFRDSSKIKNIDY